jgi:hypothetical protein
MADILDKINDEDTSLLVAVRDAIRDLKLPTPWPPIVTMVKMEATYGGISFETCMDRIQFLIRDVPLTAIIHSDTPLWMTRQERRTKIIMTSGGRALDLPPVSGLLLADCVTMPDGEQLVMFRYSNDPADLAKPFAMAVVITAPALVGVPAWRDVPSFA